MEVVAALSARSKCQKRFSEGGIFVEFMDEFLGEFQFVFLFEIYFYTFFFKLNGLLDIGLDDGFEVNDFLGIGEFEMFGGLRILTGGM